MGQDQPESWPPPGQPWAGQPAAPPPAPPSVPSPAPPTAVPAPREEWARPPEAELAQQQWVPPPQPWTAGPQQTVPGRWPPQQPAAPVGPPEPPRAPGTWNRAMVLAVIFAVVVLLAGGGIGWWLWQRPTHHPPVSPQASSGPAGRAGPSSAPAGGGVAGGAAPRTAPPSAGATTAPSPSPDPQAQALAQLDQLRQQSRARVALDGRWVAQVASKSVGITDPLQTAANGTHTFYASDILAESVAARNLVDDPGKVYVLWGTDFGKRSQAPDGKPYWITLADAGFASSAAVQQWCRTSFPTLDAQQLADTCAPRQLTPPHN